MASQVMRITLKAYDHQLVDASAKKIIETVKKNGSQVSGPVPLPTNVLFWFGFCFLLFLVFGFSRQGFSV